MKRYLVTLALATAALPLFGGGFYVNVKPATTPVVRAPRAALVAYLVGCHEAEKGTLTATAEGLIDGQRKTLPVKVISLEKPGWFAVERQWPDSGRWVVVLSAKHPAFPAGATAALPIADGAPEFSRTKHDHGRPLARADVDALLK